MESLGYLVEGLGTALQPYNLLFALIGCLIGTAVGVLPGVGPTAATAMLIPMTIALDPIAAIIMLSAIYYGAQYGGTITSVLINTPGEVASAVTCIDGYQMAKRGRAATALAVSAVGSFIGGTIASFGLVLLAIPLTSMALKFGPPEFFALMVFGLTLVVGLGGKSLKRAVIAACLGLLIGLVGIDPVAGEPRFTFGMPELLDGLDFVPVLMGLFGVSEILLNLSGGGGAKGPQRVAKRTEWRVIGRAMPAIGRGTGLGFLLGLVPGIGAAVPTYLSYALERKVSRHPERFGQGAVEGVAGPETANNSYASASMIPLFTLGIPGSATLAVLMGAFLMNGLSPGPLLFSEHPDFAWAVIASFYVGNIILIVLNLPLIPMWVQILKVPYKVLYPLILVMAVVGSIALRGEVFDAGVMLFFGLVGVACRRLDIPLAPISLTLILGPMIEKSLRQSLSLSQGDFSIFFNRPISLTLMVLSVVVIGVFALNLVRGDSRVESEA
ncbi:tripartite tricarboxylate transporter permease [Nonomuraea sp. NPDC046570]|uniref:tripartite tricarboxylate transporter permease n=1 Tax=Nonomuraea sp. NPDC046570 TaxID=3155255 RepID=UPI0033C23E7E